VALLPPSKNECVVLAVKKKGSREGEEVGSKGYVKYKKTSGSGTNGKLGFLADAF